VAFNNDVTYTLAGAALTLANTNGAAAVVAAERGVHILNVPLLLASNTVVRAAEDAAVVVNGGVSGAATLGVEGPGALAVPDTAALAVDALSLSGEARVVVSNTAALTIPVALGIGGGVFAPAAGQPLVVVSAVTGAGGLGKEVSSVLMMTSANAAYTGVARVGGGTLRTDTLPDGGLAFGPGTLHYIGGSATVAGGYTLDTGASTLAGVLRTEGDITFQGNVSALSGALVKTGPGTSSSRPLAGMCSAPTEERRHAAVLDIGAYGDSPTVGFGGFNIADGTVVIGASGQTNVFSDSLVVGLNSATMRTPKRRANWTWWAASRRSAVNSSSTATTAIPIRR
jgi:hypothetical protein